MKVEMMAVERLIPYARNPRRNDGAVDATAASIKEFGFRQPIVVDEEMVILVGHTRTKAAQKLGLSQVPVHVATGLTEAQKKAYRIADNRTGEIAEWDNDLLALELEDLRMADFDLGTLAFDAAEVDELLAGLDATPEGQTDDDETPDVQVAVKTQPGDVWLLGKHRVMCGDSTNLQHAQSLMGGGMADLLVTDPPYNVAYEGGTKDKLTIQNDAMSDTDFRQFLRDCYTTADAFMRPGAVFYIWHADSEGLNFRAAAAEVGWTVRQCLVWNKNSLVLGRQDYHWKHEPCLYGWKDGAAHYFGSDRAQTTVLDFARPNRNGEHPTMKPVDLIQYQVENSSRAGDTVLDLFGGSGTTLIACEKTGRINRSMELDPKYCDVIVRRWQQYTGKSAVHAETGQEFGQ